MDAWSALRPQLLYPSGERTPSTHYTGACDGPRAGVGIAEKKQISSPLYPGSIGPNPRHDTVYTMTPYLHTRMIINTKTFYNGRLIGLSKFPAICWENNYRIPFLSLVYISVATCHMGKSNTWRIKKEMKGLTFVQGTWKWVKDVREKS